MPGTECVVVKVLRPTKRKAEWLAQTAEAFSQAVQSGLDAAQAEQTSSRAKLHKLVYNEARQRFDLPADYARLVVNTTVSMARAYYGMRRSQHFRSVSFPRVNGCQGIGLGVNAYKVVQSNDRWVLRLSTGKRGRYIWLPLCVPKSFRDRIDQVYGDARLFKRGDDWYVMLPIRVIPAPTIRDGEQPALSAANVFIGVDLGIVRLATVATPTGIVYFDGKAARSRREHFADLRRRYQRAGRIDRVKRMKGKEARWMRDLNHQISKRIIELALEYDHPVIVFERLDGIRNRIKASKRFNRMMASWAFRQLINFVEYKATRQGIPVIFVDPRGTSKTCSRCEHDSRYNRRDQGHFRCTRCGFQENADGNAAVNIAAAGSAWVQQHGLPDTARATM
jgi:IS605 OrfB family transposase